MFQLLLLACLTGASFGANIPGRGEIEGFIMGGKDTNISEVPYQVALLHGGGLACGGSIVAPTMIVTAAHCVRDISPSVISFRAGSSNLNSGGVVIRLKKFWIPSNYNDKTYDYDVAVVELKQPLQYCGTIKPIKLATSRPPDGALVTASGWGQLREHGPLSTSLQSVKVPIVNSKTCAFNYASYVNITPRMVCAGIEGKDSCTGDSGGPLNANEQLAGIVSFGVGCGRRDFPGVYTDVSNPDINSFIRKYAKI